MDCDGCPWEKYRIQKEKKMRHLNLVVILLVAFTMGIIFSPLFLGIASAYEERNGSWTASEKRQVINLLEKIEDNTQ